MRSYNGRMAEFPIIDKLGGREAAAKRLAAAGLKCTKHTLRMWVARGDMSADGIRFALQVAHEDGIEYGPDDFRLSASEAA